MSKNLYNIGLSILMKESILQFHGFSVSNRKAKLTLLFLQAYDQRSKNIDVNVNNEEKNKYVDTTPNLTARSYALLVIEPKLTIPEQKKMVEYFNVFLNENREKYNSLFLTNYREDVLKLTFTEDVSLSMGTLAHLYKLLYWSKPNGKNIVREEF